MEIKYQNKPSQEALDAYIRKIEEFLSALDIKLKIDLLDKPIILNCTRNNILTEQIYFWIDQCIVSKDGKNLKVDLINEGIPEDLNRIQLWNDAWYIQEQIYQILYKRINKPEDSDPYWKLWDH